MEGSMSDGGSDSDDEVQGESRWCASRLMSFLEEMGGSNLSEGLPSLTLSTAQASGGVAPGCVRMLCLSGAGAVAAKRSFFKHKLHDVSFQCLAYHYASAVKV